MSVSTTEAVAKIFQKLAKEKVKGMNVMDVCFSLPDQGVGHRLSKTIWPERNSYWTITRVNFSKNSGGRSTSLRGSAYGILTWGGKTEMKERKVIDHLDKVWTTFPHIYQSPKHQPENPEPVSEKTEEEQQQ